MVRMFFTTKVAKGVYPNIHGTAPQQTGLSDVSSDHPTDRLIVREGWNGQYAAGNVNGHKPSGTPFRIVNNSGDYLARKDYACRAGGAGCDGTGIAASSGNSKYVYDSSDYMRFKKLQAKGRNYNDYSTGGNQNNGAYSARNRVRH